MCGTGCRLTLCSGGSCCPRQCPPSPRRQYSDSGCPAGRVVACSGRRREGSRAGGPGQPRGKARARLAGRDRSIGGVQSAQTAAVQHSQWLNKRRLRGTLKPVTKHD